MTWVTIFFRKFLYLPFVYNEIKNNCMVLSAFCHPQRTHITLSHELRGSWTVGLFKCRWNHSGIPPAHRQLLVTSQKALVKSMSLIFWFSYSYDLDVSNFFFCNKQPVLSSWLSKLICKSLCTCTWWVFARLHV